MKNPFRRGLWTAIDNLSDRIRAEVRSRTDDVTAARHDARSYTDAARESLAAGLRELAVRVEAAEQVQGAATSSRSGLANALKKQTEELERLDKREVEAREGLNELGAGLAAQVETLAERLVKVEGAVGMEREDADNGDSSVLARIEALETKPRSSRARKRQAEK